MKSVDGIRYTNLNITREEERACFERYKLTNNKNELAPVFNAFSGIVKIKIKMSPYYYSHHYEFDDFFQEFYYHILRNLHKFDPMKPQRFSSYFGNKFFILFKKKLHQRASCDNRKINYLNYCTTEPNIDCDDISGAVDFVDTLVDESRLHPEDYVLYTEVVEHLHAIPKNIGFYIKAHYADGAKWVDMANEVGKTALSLEWSAKHYIKKIRQTLSETL
jgi:hypothetical protein